MGRESVHKGQSFNNKASLVNVHVLVVDDDATSLAIVAAMLKTWKYEVFTVKHPADALSTLRVQPGVFDLVVTDLHMPDMNGFELQKRVEEEFKLPVIMMSADDKESVMLRSLAGGTAFYIVKPVNPDDLKNVWQYAVAAKKGKSVVIEEIGSIPSIEKISHEDINSSSSVSEEKRAKDGKRKAGKRVRDELEERSTAITIKKAKVVWTNSLHNQFLEAIKHIGLEKAVPKKILEFMDVAGLTRENVASHLQKYRIFLRKVAERGVSAPKNVRSRFMLKNFQEEYQKLVEDQQMIFQQKFGENFPALGARNNLGFVRFPNDQEASMPQLGYGQSHIMRCRPNYQQSLLCNTNLLHRANRSTSGLMRPGNIGVNFPADGGSSYGLKNQTNGLMNGTNLMQMYLQKTAQTRPDIFASGKSNNNVGTSGILSANYNPHTENMGYLRNANPTPNVNHTDNNYAGIRMTGDGELVGMGNRHNDAQVSAGLGGGYGLMNGIYNGTLTIAPMGNGVLGRIVQGETSCRFENANKFQPVGSGIPGPFAQGESYSARLETANDPPLFSDVSEQENIVLPNMPQQQYGIGDGGENNFNSDVMNNVPTLNNIFLSEELDNLNDLFLEQINNYEIPNQQQGGEETVLNTDFSDGSFAESNTYIPISELLNDEFSGSCSVEEIEPWNGQSLGQGWGKEFMDSLFGTDY